MKLNKKGITLIEIIVAIVLISIVLVFIAILLVDVKDINDNSQTNSTYLINKALITKIIEEDLIKYNKIKISSCENGIKSIYSSYNVNNITEGKNKFSECLKLTFNGDNNNYAYLGLFYLNSHDNYVISYIHGTHERITYDFNGYVEYNVKNTGIIKNDSLKMNVLVSDTSNPVRKFDNLGTFNSSASAIVINIPMIGNDGKDYTISIPYYGEVSIG